MDSAEALALMMGFVVCVGYALPLVLVAVLVWWVGTRSSRALTKGLAQLQEGRILEAYESFDACNDKLLLRGQASTWLWRLNTARHELDSAASILERRDELKVAPYLALAAALRGDRDVEDWVMLSGARSSNQAEARLGLSVMELRRGHWKAALEALPSSTGNPRARALLEVVSAMATTQLDGQPRKIDSASLLGEGSISELEQWWPQLAEVLKQGTTTPPDQPISEP